MIIGVGTDLVEIQRVSKALEQLSGGRFLERVLTPGERELAQRRRGRLTEFTAGRFAAKEAVVKALGCGIGKLVGFQDIEVLPDSLGKPVCRLTDGAVQRLGWPPGSGLSRTGPASGAELSSAPVSGSAHGPSNMRIHLSITHTDSFAAAYAIVEDISK